MSKNRHGYGFFNICHYTLRGNSAIILILGKKSEGRRMGLKDTMTMQEAQKMKEQLEQVFSVVRLLDGEVLETGEGIEPPCQCYSIWGKSEQCGNCVSRKALQEKRQKTKIEFIDSRVYQVIAKYLNIDGKPYVMKMINR